MMCGRRAGYGLSPRVRGNRYLQMRNVDAVGSIPACAGEPLSKLGLMEAQGVYPRVCGGAQPLSHWREQSAGLSPGVRGNQEWGAPSWE